MKILKNMMCCWLCIVMLGACASVERKFSGEKIANIASFSEQTNALLSQYNAAQISNDAKSLHEVLQADSEEMQTFRARAKVINAILDAVKHYSAQLVVISESGQSDKEQVGKYHQFISQYAPSLASALELPSSHFDGVLAAVATQENLLKAIRTAEPIIAAANAQMGRELPKANEAVQKIAEAAQSRLNEQYKLLLNSRAPLYAERADVLSAYIKELEQNKSANKMSANTRQRVQDLHSIQQLLAGDWLRYQNTMEAIAELEDSVFTESQRIRYFMDVWAHAHRKMASGVYLPAEWFDVNDLPGQLIRRVKL